MCATAMHGSNYFFYICFASLAKHFNLIPFFYALAIAIRRLSAGFKEEETLAAYKCSMFVIGHFAEATRELAKKSLTRFVL